MKNILITGGAGFIGSNLADYYLKKKCRVVIFDDMSRKGTDINLQWLEDVYPHIQIYKGDVRNRQDIDTCIEDFGPFDIIFHMAAQVAVTTSVTDPQSDFEINAIGSFNLLESIRNKNANAIVIYASTNKVYGEMKHIEIAERDNRYVYKDYPRGITENENLDFHSPYGCSKGCADQYFLDYYRIYGIKTIVLRQSCIYGYRQFGIEDQGWVAWFTIASMFNKPITVYGDGKQVRDILFIDDLLSAYDQAINHIDATKGNAYNIGGCEYNMSLLELVAYLENYIGTSLNIGYADWRPGDQKVFIGDIEKAYHDFGWYPQVDVQQGVQKLMKWVDKNRAIFSQAGLV